MSGYKSRSFRHQCQRDGCFMDARAPDLEWMRDCFPRDIIPSDIDGMVEIDGHVLFIEVKGEEGFIKNGQRRALLALSDFPAITVLNLRPQRGNHNAFEWLIFGQGDPNGWQPCTQAQVHAWITAWAEHAQRVPYMPKRTNVKGAA